MIHEHTSHRSARGAALAGGLILAMASGLAAQQPQEVVVPLSDPAKPVILEVSLLNGSISVEAHEGSEVIVSTTIDAAEDEETERRGGLTRIPNTSVGLTIEERGNTVSIDSDWSARSTRLVVRVPARTSAHLSTVNDGDLVIAGITGSRGPGMVGSHRVLLDGPHAPRRHRACPRGAS